MNVNFPNRGYVVTRDRELRVVRRLPGSGEIKVRTGERLTADHVLVRTDPKSAAVVISLADQLGVPPQDVTKHLMKPVGATFSAGEALARNRKGLRSVVVAAPIGGTLLSIDETGTAQIAPGSGGDIRAMIAGDVEFIDGKESISIRTAGSRLYGIVGLGQNVSGTLRIVAGGASEELQASKIHANLAGAIVVGGSFASAAALNKLIEVGAAGVITGGIVDREVMATMGVASDDRMALWRLKPGQLHIGEGRALGVSMMATEGFGSLPMNPDVFQFLKEVEGKPAVLFTATRVVGFLERPKLIVVSEEMLDDDVPVQTTSLQKGGKARLVDQNGLGQSVTVGGSPRRSRRGDGNLIEVVDVLSGSGQSRTVPLANVEVIA
jgi:hypothetical protein